MKKHANLSLVAAIVFAASAVSPDLAHARVGGPTGGNCSKPCHIDKDGNVSCTVICPSSTGGTDVPEPGMLGLFGLGLGAAGVLMYRRRKAK